MEIKALLEKIITGNDLTVEETTEMMNLLMEGKIPPTQMAALLVALRMKGETVDEITACAKVMREKATKIPTSQELLVDTCGTGGDSSGSINISTTVALLVAGGGYKVAKHGNRSMTSKSGSADLLEALGINLGLTPEQVGECIDKVGIGFLFAPALHSAMKNVVPVRKELAVRSIFNMLGPLTNPAGAQTQIIGVFSTGLVPKIIRVLKELGLRSAFVVAGESGLDEVCVAGNTRVARLTADGNIEEFVFNPEEYGYQKATMESIKGDTPEENAKLTRQILSGELKGPKRDVIALNAGFAIAAAEECSLKEGFAKAEELLDSGAGLKVVESLKELTNQLAK